MLAVQTPTVPWCPELQVCNLQAARLTELTGIQQLQLAAFSGYVGDMLHLICFDCEFVTYLHVVNKINLLLRVRYEPLEEL